MRRVIFNQKGGVGKSSIAVNLAAITAKQGFRTLVVDLDAQCNASQYLLGLLPDDKQPNIADFYEQFLSFRLVKRQPEDFVQPTPYERLSLISSSPRLAEMQHRLEMKHKIFKMREALEQLRAKFEFVFIDTPPAFNFYTLSALIAGDACLIPFDCDAFSRQALYTLMENVEEVRGDHNEKLFVEGIIINQFLERARLPRELVEALEKEGLPVLPAKLSTSVKMRESHQTAKPLIYLDAKHKLTREYVALYKELVRRRAESRHS
jgi:chromosome partitioning protein